ncbi:MAG: macro domain-containing protein, partial [Desulfobacterales bacterium]
RLLSQCYRNSLQLAVDHNLKSIAFPAISCGVYGYPLAAACKIAVDTTCEFLQTKTALEKVIFILFSSADYKVYEDYMRSLA